MDKKNPRTGSRNKEDLREWKNLDNSSRQGYDQQGLSAKEILFLRDQIIGISYIATQTRKSLVKGERFIRAVWKTRAALNWMNAFISTAEKEGAPLDKDKI